MKTVYFGDSLIEKLIVCLGSFDGVHKGHLTLLNNAMKLKNANEKVALLTFDEGFSRLMKGDKSIFTLPERMDIFERLGVDVVIVAKCDNVFLSLTAEEFLSRLTSSYNISGAVCGNDYKFGYQGRGNSKSLFDYLTGNNIACRIVPDVIDGMNKISSSLIKKHLKSGHMQDVSRLLGYDYFTQGKVIHGANLGAALGFPTLNTKVPKEKKMLKRGVYKTYTEIDGVIYNSITNYGSAPTFNRNNFIIETHVLDFNKNVYGKIVKVYFKEFIRGVIKFNSMQELIDQIKEDIKIYD